MREIKPNVNLMIKIMQIILQQFYFSQIKKTTIHIIRKGYLRRVYSSSNVPRLYKCGLCDKVFKSEDELSNHVKSAAH